MAAGTGARGRRCLGRGGSWLASHPVEIAFALLVIAAFAYSLRITVQYFFSADDWLFVKQGGSFGGWFQAYNDQIAVTMIGTWRILAGLFGFDFTPFRVVGMVGMFAVPAAYFLTTRRQLGAVVAALLALPLAWYGRYISLSPNLLEQYLVLLGAIGCAAALNRGRRADWVLAGSLAFALCSAGGGVAVAAACLAHNLCTRAPLRRWLAVVVPTLAWLGWWLIEGRTHSRPVPYPMTTSQTLQFVRDLAYTSFETTALGVGVLAMVLVAAFVAYGIWILRKGLNAGANCIAWSIGLVAWAVGVAHSRGLLFAQVTVFRYRYVALGLILLAVVPRRPIVWPARFPIGTDRRFVVVGAVVVLALGSARALAVRDDMNTAVDTEAARGLATRGETLVIELGPDVVPDETPYPFEFGEPRAGEFRALFAKYGNPFPPARATADRQLVAMQTVQSDPAGPRHLTCKPMTRPFAYTPVGSVPTQYLWSPNMSFTVDVRRFGEHWVRLDKGRPGIALRLLLPRLGVDTPWHVRANGACLASSEAR